MIKKLKSFLKSPYVAIIMRLILGGVFLYASIDKIIHPAKFAQAIQNYRLIPIELTNVVGIFLPWLEFYCGLFLIIGLFNRASSCIIAALLSFFIIALTSAIIRGLDIACGCYGSGTNVSWGRVVEDLLLLAIALNLIFYASEKFTLDNRLSKSRNLTPPL
jgi:uncharacterized membrane protein YphA (DoxX/SURF4 family)